VIPNFGFRCQYIFFKLFGREGEIEGLEGRAPRALAPSVEFWDIRQASQSSALHGRVASLASTHSPISNATRVWRGELLRAPARCADRGLLFALMKLFP
jgi:hypothetical protein